MLTARTETMWHLWAVVPAVPERTDRPLCPACRARSWARLAIHTFVPARGYDHVGPLKGLPP